MAFDPKPGDVMRYDFLWYEEQQRGLEFGAKDRPCTIVLATKPKPDGTRRLMLAAITHTPPSSDDRSILVPAKLARHLGLDDQPQWIKTQQVNTMTCPKERVPIGFVPTERGEWAQGHLPKSLSDEVFANVREHSRAQTLRQVERDEKPPSKPRPKQQGKPRPSGEKPRPGQTRRDDRDQER